MTWDIIKRIYKSRTMRFAFLLSIASALEMNLGILTPYINKETLGLIGAGLSLSIAILRFVTSSPILMSEEKEKKETDSSTTEKL